MVVDHIENHLQPGVVQVRDHLLELGDLAAGQVARVGREKGDAVVAPVVVQALVQQVLVVDERVNRQQLDTGNTQVLDVLEQFVVGQAGEGTAQLLRHSGVAHADAAGVRLVEDGALPRYLYPLVTAPGEGRVDHLALGHEGGAVTFIERQVVVWVADGVAKQRLGPLQFADQLLGIRVDQQFVGVEAVTVLRLVRAVDAVAIHQARVRIGQVAMVDLVRVFGQLDAFELMLAGGVEQAQLDLGGIGRKQGEVDAQPIPGGAEGKGLAFADAGWGNRAGFLRGTGAHGNPQMAVVKGMEVMQCCPGALSVAPGPPEATTTASRVAIMGERAGREVAETGLTGSWLFDRPWFLRRRGFNPRQCRYLGFGRRLGLGCRLGFGRGPLARCGFWRQGLGLGQLAGHFPVAVFLAGGFTF